MEYNISREINPKETVGDRIENNKNKKTNQW